MKVTILYFAGLREALRTDRETLELPAGVETSGQLRAWLRGRGGAWAEQLAEGRAVKVSVDRRMADAGAALADGAEVAFFPPVTGG